MRLARAWLKVASVNVAAAAVAAATATAKTVATRQRWQQPTVKQLRLQA